MAITNFRNDYIPNSGIISNAVNGDINSSPAGVAPPVRAANNPAIPLPKPTGVPNPATAIPLPKPTGVPNPATAIPLPKPLGTPTPAALSSTIGPPAGGYQSATSGGFGTNSYTGAPPPMAPNGDLNAIPKPSRMTSAYLPDGSTFIPNPKGEPAPANGSTAPLISKPPSAPVVPGAPVTPPASTTPPSVTGGPDPGEPKLGVIGSALSALPSLTMAQTGPAASVYDLVNKYTSEDSSLRQRLEAKAMEYANSRGLQNSSIAAGAATGALIDGITPIATSDAGAQNQINLSNTGELNKGTLAAFGQAGNERITGMNNASSQLISDRNNASSQLISDRNNATQLTAVGMNNTSAQLIADRNNATQSGIAAGNNATQLSAASIQAAASANLQAASLAFQDAQNSLSRAQQTAIQQSDFGFRQWSQITSQGQQAMTTYASQSLNITQLQIPQADKDAMLQHLNYVYTGNPMTAFTLPPPPSYSSGSTPPPPVTPQPTTLPPPTPTPPATAPPTTTPPTFPINWRLAS